MIPRQQRPPTQLRLAWDLIKIHYKAASAEWDPVFSKLDEKPERLGKAGFTGLEKMLKELSCGSVSREKRTSGHYLVRDVGCSVHVRIILSDQRTLTGSRDHEPAQVLALSLAVEQAQEVRTLQ